jgi:DNA polymerase
VLLGEAPGEDEDKAGVPFVGASGRLLKRDLMPSAGLDPSDWHMLNVFTSRPPNNDLKLWTANKTELKKLGQVPQGDPLNKRFLLAEHRHHLAELDARLRQLAPDLILCLGGTALWAISGDGAIGTHRGTFFRSRYGLAIATYHPAAILRQWSNKPVAWADMRKVAAHLDGTLTPPLRRRFYVNPSWQEIAEVYSIFAANPSWMLGVDIETCPGIDQITTISFCTPTLGICIPIWDKNNVSGGHNYWATVSDERKAWRWINRFAQLANPKVLQNGLYDSQYLLDAPIDIRLRHWQDDDAILHHALQPELQKSLGFLSSIYLNEPSWKQMRTSNKDAKADE